MPDRHTIRHAEQRSATDADQTEKTSILTGAAVLDAGLRDEQIAQTLDDEFNPDLAGLDDQAPGRERWHRQDLAVDGGVGALREEIERRVAFLGASYPFRIDGNSLVYLGDGASFYEYCLGISVAPNVTTGEYVELARTFERVVALIVKLYMGIHAESLHTGAPRDPGFGTWYASMQELGRLTGEWTWAPEPGYPEEPSVGGDAGMDFVVWKKALDRRPGNLYIIGQCACGNDWSDKLSDLDMAELGTWFHPMTFIPPTKAFATPFALSDGNFQRAHKRAGWVLDRIRLTSMVEQVAHDTSYQAWQQRLGEMLMLSMRNAA